MHRFALVLAFTLTVFGFAAPASAQCGSPIGGWPYGPSLAADGNGQLAVFSSGRVLQVVRWNDPSGPEVVGSLEMPGRVNDVEVSGSWAYVAELEAGIAVVDFSSPSQPVLAAEIETENSVRTVTIVGDLLAAGDGVEGLMLIDVSTPSDPVRLSALPVDGVIHNIAIHGTLAFVGEQYFGFRVVDIADTANPVTVGSIEELEHPRRVAVSDDGNTVYLTNYFDGINVIDVTDHLAPEVVGFVDNPSYTIDVLAEGGYLYAANRGYGMRIYDLADPTSPVEVAQVDSPGSNYSVAVHGDVAFLANYSGGLRLVDISVPTEPAEFGYVEGFPESQGVAIQAGLVFVPGGSTNMVIDASRPDELETLSSLSVSGYVETAVIDGRYVYAAADYRGIRVIDVADPKNPEEVGFIDFDDDDAVDVVKDGDLLYVVCYNNGIKVVDVADPTAPAVIGELTGFGALRLDHSGDVVYVNDYGVGVHIVDVANPSSPVMIGTIETDEAYHRPVVDGELLFVPDYDAGIGIFDVADPRSPVELVWIPVGGYAYGVAAAADALFIATIYNGAYVYDIADPTSPVEIANTPLATRAEADLTSEGNLVLVAELAGGIETFDLGACSLAVPSADFTWRPGNPEAGRSVRLTDTSVGAVETRQWNFGDGSGSAQRNPSHVWAEAGDYEVRLTVGGPQGSQQVTKTVTVSPRSGGVPPITDPGDHVYVIAAAAHVQGLEDTRWVTDAVLHNPGATAAEAYVWFMKSGQNNTGAEGQSVAVPAGGSLLVADVVYSVFGEDDASGGLLIGSDQPLVVTSRTYNDAESGTYGQFIAGREVGDGVVEDETVRLIQLTRSDDFRSNLGVANPSGSAVVVDVSLRSAAGGSITSTSLTVPPYGYLQRTDILGTDAEDAIAVVSSETAGALYFPYVSVVDNRTGDPIFIEPIGAAERVVIAAAAHVGGLENTDWRTDLEICNFDDGSAELELALLETDQSNASPQTAAMTVAASGCTRVADVLDATFDYEGSAALDIESGKQAVTASSRTYNTTNDGTFGQFLPGLANGGAFGPGDEGRIVQLAQSSGNSTGFRTNIGFVNRSATAITVDVELRYGTGTSLGSLSVPLQPYEHRQINRIYRQVTAGNVDNGFAVVSTSNPNGAFFAYASVVDNASGDPVYVPAVEVEN